MLLGMAWLDPVVGIVGAGVILRWAWGLLSSSGRILLDYNEDDDTMQQARTILLASGVEHIQDLHVWRVSPQQCFLMATVKGQTIHKNQLLKKLQDTNLYAHITIDMINI